MWPDRAITSPTPRPLAGQADEPAAERSEWSPGHCRSDRDTACYGTVGAAPLPPSDSGTFQPMCLPPRATVEGANQINNALTTVAATQQIETRAQHPEASMCQVEIVDRMQGFTLSPEAYIRFRMRPSISAVDANSHGHHCHKPIDLMHLNAKQAKRIASRRAMRDRLSRMAPTPLEADALILHR